MSYVPFHTKFPEIADKEDRSIIIFDDPDLPDGTYGFIESYCSEPGCDCRRVFVNVISIEKEILSAVIAFGWESKKYYAKWLWSHHPEILKEIKGPVLNSDSSQSEYAPEILKKVELALEDKYYINNLKKHYKLFKNKIEEEEKRRRTGHTDKNSSILPSSHKIGRNDTCPCGSGKKYKNAVLINNIRCPSRV